MRQQELDHRPLIRAQAFGEAVDPARLERLARYEVHLDRKLERMLAMLVKLRELRRIADRRDPFRKICPSGTRGCPRAAVTSGRGVSFAE